MSIRLHTTAQSNLRRLLVPESIAVIGASPSPQKAGFQMLRALAKFEGELYPIHPKATEVLGRKAYPSLTAIGKTVDLAILAIPAEGCAKALRDAADARCGGALIVSGGFAETGDELDGGPHDAGPRDADDPRAGAARQAALAAICAQSGIRLLGPNTSGFINPRVRCAASFAPGVEGLKPGAIGIVAQSGGINLTLSFLVHQLGLGLSTAVGLGNMTDVDAADVLEHLAADADTRAIALHLEGVPNGRKLFEMLARVTPVKPVVAMAVGRADIGAFARSHTGNLIGSHARKIAALKQAGAVIVDSTEDLATAVATLSRVRLPPKPRPGIALLTGQAGPGLVVADELRSRGVALPELADATATRLRDLLPPLTYTHNPVDTGRPSPVFADVLDAIAADPAIDAIGCFTLHEPAAIDPVAVLGGAVKRSVKPIVFGTMGAPGSIAPTLAALATSGVPAFAAPERLALALRVLAEDARAAWRLRETPAPAVVVPSESIIQSDFDEASAKELLGLYGIGTPKRVICRTPFGARDAFNELAKPVVLKILSREIAHKSEAGGVHLGIATIGELGAALAKLDQIPLAGERRYLVEEMAPPGVELVIGGVRDPAFGPTVAVGLGGVMVEAIGDVAVRLAPLGEADALEMLDELRGRAVLDGWRGAPAADRHAIARAIVAVGALMAAHPAIAELDVNPVRAYADRVLALDALIVRAV